MKFTGEFMGEFVGEAFAGGGWEAPGCDGDEPGTPRGGSRGSIDGMTKLGEVELGDVERGMVGVGCVRKAGDSPPWFDGVFAAGPPDVEPPDVGPPIMPPKSGNERREGIGDGVFPGFGDAGDGDESMGRVPGGGGRRSAS